MKKVDLTINLYSFSELIETSKEKAINEHFLFLASNGLEIEDLNGGITTDNYSPTTEEVVESIEANKYFFFESGELAKTITFTGSHPMSGSTVFEYLGTRVFL